MKSSSGMMKNGLVARAWCRGAPKRVLVVLVVIMALMPMICVFVTQYTVDHKMVVCVAVHVSELPRFRAAQGFWAPPFLAKRALSTVHVLYFGSTSLAPALDYVVFPANTSAVNKSRDIVGFMTQHVPNADWYAKFDDDTFVNVSALEHVLSKYNPLDKTFIGTEFSLGPIPEQEAFFSGGAGYVLSRALAQQLPAILSLCPVENLARLEDFYLYKCLKRAGAVKLCHEASFNHFEPERMLEIGAYSPARHAVTPVTWHWIRSPERMAWMHEQVPTTAPDPMVIQVWPFSESFDHSSNAAAMRIRSCQGLAQAHGIEHRVINLGAIQGVRPYCQHVTVEAGATLGGLLELYRLGGFSMHHSVNCSNFHHRNWFVGLLGEVRGPSRRGPLCTCLGASCKAAYCDPYRFLVFQALTDAVFGLLAHNTSHFQAQPSNETWADAQASAEILDTPWLYRRMAAHPF